MKLKNHELESFIIFLQKLDLSGKPSRMRTRFKSLLMEKYQQLLKEKEEIAIRFAQKNDDGSPMTKEDDSGQVIYTIDDTKACEKELNELFLEDVVIDETGERIEMLKSVKISVLDYNEPNSGQDADNWNRFCEIVEEIT